MLRRAIATSILLALVVLVAAGTSDAAKGRKNQSFKLKAPAVDAVYPKAKGTAKLKWMMTDPYLTVSVKAAVPDGTQFICSYGPTPLTFEPFMTGWMTFANGKAQLTEISSLESIGSITVFDIDFNVVASFPAQ